MTSRIQGNGKTFSLIAAFLATTVTLHAAPIRVDCNRGGSINSTLTGLTNAGNTRGITILVTGTCRENISIFGFDHLYLLASPVATLEDTSNGTAPVVKITGSYDVELSNFTINGGSNGVNCAGYSNCVLGANTIRNSSGPGVRFGRSEGTLVSNNILETSDTGITLTGGSNLFTSSNVIRNNVRGITVAFGSNLAAYGDTIQSNYEAGIVVVHNSVLNANDLTISNNATDGVWVEANSTAVFQQNDAGNVITGNGYNGVSINDLSFAEFDGSNNVSGNQWQPDVACYPQFSATRGAGTVGGTTDCMEPEHKK